MLHSMVQAAVTIKKSLFGRVLKRIYRTLLAAAFHVRYRKYKGVSKIIYALTPSPNLPNVGDQAQALAINRWFKDYFKEYTVLEFTKDEVYRYVTPLKRIVNNDDLIFLHSGGNLGDRGIWSENARRLIIQNFADNRIISLPQTIFFSSTPNGQKELAATRDIYNRHPRLTVMARDGYSFGLAKEYFPKCRVLLIPDFVLYLKDELQADSKRQGALLCLRRDNESSIDSAARQHIVNLLVKHGLAYTEFDTTLGQNIPKKERELRLAEVLELFRKAQLVITDRFHGVIFAVITGTPCVALKTVDHKLTESVKWFKEYSSVVYTEDMQGLPEAISAVLKARASAPVNWRTVYFEGLRANLLKG